MEKHIKHIKKIVAVIGFKGVEVVINNLGGFCTISLENSYWESYEYMEKLRKYLDTNKYWIEPYSSCEIIIGLE